MLSTELALDILLGHQYFLSYVHTVAVLYTVLFPFTASQNFPLAEHRCLQGRSSCSFARMHTLGPIV